MEIHEQRHLLRLIRQLTKGMRALSQRKFETRLNIPPQDELRLLVSAFNDMTESLKQYEQTRRQRLSDISHELRTPLAILWAEIEAMQDGVRPINETSLSSLRAEVLHLSKIVHDLHELSSVVDSGMIAIKREPVDPICVLKMTLKAFELRFAERSLALREELGESETLIVGDADRLRQVFANILENALKYVDTPGILKIRRLQRGGELTLNFIDSGPGVPEDSLERLFDRFYRVDSSQNRQQGGCGLGLAICKNIVEALGGRIKAANIPSAGLSLEIRLPLILDWRRKKVVKVHGQKLLFEDKVNLSK